MKTISQTFALAAALATISGASLLTSTTADAGGRGKQLYIETYQSKEALHGYSGHAGNSYCDYQRLPIRKCSNGHSDCKIVGWTLQQICQ